MTHTTMETGTAAKAETRAARLRRMLASPEGASLAAICSTMGWQPHSARAAISGLRKAGYQVDRERSTEPGGSPVYRLITEAPAGATAGRPA